MDLASGACHGFIHCGFSASAWSAQDTIIACIAVVAIFMIAVAIWGSR